MIGSFVQTAKKVRRRLIAISNANRHVIPAPLSKHAKKGSSQITESGVLDAIFAAIPVRRKYFVEFGIGPNTGDPTYKNGLEGNCVDLKTAGWDGLFMDAGTHPPHYNVQREFITSVNINHLLAKYSVPENFALISIDVDGQDLWIWKALKARPEVVVIEYNPIHGPDKSVTVPFNLNFSWDGTNYYGASLRALNKVGTEKGYRLVYVNAANAFFVLDKLIANRSDFNFDILYQRHDYHAPDPLGRLYVDV